MTEWRRLSKTRQSELMESLIHEMFGAKFAAPVPVLIRPIVQKPSKVATAWSIDACDIDGKVLAGDVIGLDDFANVVDPKDGLRVLLSRFAGEVRRVGNRRRSRRTAA